MFLTERPPGSLGTLGPRLSVWHRICDGPHRTARSASTIAGSMTTGETTMRILNIGSGLLMGCLASLCAGCAAHAQATGYAEADAPVVFAEPPTLVTIEPDIWVVQDSAIPVYYVDDYYWAYRGGAWYRSPSYDGGWVTVEAIVVPQRVVNRDHRVYVHYHGVANAATRVAPRARFGHEKQEERHERAEPEHAQERQNAERENQARDRAHGGGPAQTPAEARGNAEHRGDLDHRAQDMKPDQKRQEKKRGRR
jgi:hypothetical protein